MGYSQTLEPAVGDNEAVNIYKCRRCAVSFTTEDEEQIFGPAPLQ